MKRFYLTLILACSAAATLPAYAATGNVPGMDNMGTVSGQATKAQTFMGQGKINSINPDANTVNIAMGPVKALGWPSMSMNFLLQNTAMLNSLKTGEIVNFVFAKDTAGGVRHHQDHAGQTMKIRSNCNPAHRGIPRGYYRVISSTGFLLNLSESIQEDSP